MNNIQKIVTLLEQQQLDAFLISSHANILYLTNYAGFSAIEREAFVLITKKHNYLITDARYTLQVKEQVENFTILERNSHTPLIKLIATVVQKEDLHIIGFEADNLTVAEFTYFKKIKETWKAVDLSQVRQQKTTEEIKKIEKACNLAHMAYEETIKQCMVGISEKQLAYIYEDYLRKHNAEPSFPTIVAFGANAVFIHHHTSERTLNKNECILVDFGARVDNYCSDSTRTTFFGTPSEEFKNAYETVKHAQELAVDKIKNTLTLPLSPKGRGKLLLSLGEKVGMRGKDIDQVARDYIMSQGFPTIPHSLGHGIGIEVHESPRLSPTSKDTLKEGMVFSIEPGIYIPNEFGIRIEDLYAVQNGQLKRLTTGSIELQG